MCWCGEQIDKGRSFPIDENLRTCLAVKRIWHDSCIPVQQGCPASGGERPAVFDPCSVRPAVRPGCAIPDAVAQRRLLGVAAWTLWRSPCGKLACLRACKRLLRWPFTAAGRCCCRLDHHWYLNGAALPARDVWCPCRRERVPARALRKQPNKPLAGLQSGLKVVPSAARSGRTQPYKG